MWLVPIAQAIQLQMVRNLPYSDHIGPVLADAVPGESGALDRVPSTGRAPGAQAGGQAIPVTSALLQPIWWDEAPTVRGTGRPAIAARR
jgi:hypothetical protein